MITRKIETLLEKFYEGDTSIYEEEQLRDFFLCHELPPHLKKHKHLFSFFENGKKDIPSPKLEEKIMAIISEESEDNQQNDPTPEAGKVIPLKPDRKRLVYSLSIAASIILIAALTITLRLNFFNTEQPYGTITDPELAYAETRNAMNMITGKMKTGFTQARQMKAFHTGMEKTEKFNKLFQYQPIIINPGEQKTQRP